MLDVRHQILHLERRQQAYDRLLPHSGPPVPALEYLLREIPISVEGKGARYLPLSSQPATFDNGCKVLSLVGRAPPPLSLIHI